MNHSQDIDDGLEEFEDHKEQQNAEERFRKRPELFDRMVSGDPFCASKINELLLNGPRIGQDDHPFSFESGYASVSGIHHGIAKVLAIRWSEHGKSLEISVRDHSRQVSLARLMPEAVDGSDV